MACGRKIAATLGWDDAREETKSLHDWRKAISRQATSHSNPCSTVMPITSEISKPPRHHAYTPVTIAATMCGQRTFTLNSPACSKISGTTNAAKIAGTASCSARSNRGGNFFPEQRGPVVIPVKAQPRQDVSSDYFFTPSFFYEVEEASSVSTLIHLIKVDVEAIAQISDEEYESFNKRWVLPSNAFFGSYDYVSVDYHHAAFAIKRMVSEVLQVTLPEADLNELVAEVIYCQHQQVLKVFDSNMWNQQADNMLRNTFGLFAATCKKSSIEIFAYFSKVQVQNKAGIITPRAQRDSDRAILSKWLGLHFVKEFN